jgi:4-diphosphocytidyl-2-C-methyl-D-erythritol kinase
MGDAFVEVRCPAKVNLFLEVLGRRADGYHEIATVFLKIALHDTLLAAPAAEGVTLSVEGADLPAGEGNLVHTAAQTFRAAFPFEGGVRLRLVKRIPVKAGLGGGSSDAAGTLLALRDLFRPGAPVESLAALAAALGSDVPFFLGGPAALGEGRGEILAGVPPPSPRWIALCFPPFALSTADVYREVLVPPESERRSAVPLLRALRESPDLDLAPHLFNRLMEAAARVEPGVPRLRERLAAVLAPGEACLLSGSGSAFFAPFASLRRALDVRRGWSGLPGCRAVVVRSLFG